MLEGFDTNWTVMPQSNLGMIVYTNLPSGDYTLRLAVFDNNRTDILEERDFTLIKARALYDRRGFMVYLLLRGLLVYGCHRCRGFRLSGRLIGIVKGRERELDFV